MFKLQYVFVLKCITELWLRSGSIYVSQITSEESFLNIFWFSCLFFFDRKKMQQRLDKEVKVKKVGVWMSDGQNFVRTLHTLQFLSPAV